MNHQMHQMDFGLALGSINIESSTDFIVAEQMDSATIDILILLHPSSYLGKYHIDSVNYIQHIITADHIGAAFTIVIRNIAIAKLAFIAMRSFRSKTLDLA